MLDNSFLGETLVHLREEITTYLPTLLGALLVFLTGWLLSLLARWAVARFFRRVGLDRWVADSEPERGMKAAGIATPLSVVAARLVFWVLLLSTLVIVLGILGIELSEFPVGALVGYLPSILGAILVLVLGTMFASFLGRSSDAGLASLGVDQHRFLGQLVRLTLVAVTFLVTLEQLGFEVALLSSTFGNLLLVIVAGFVLAFAWGGREVARAVLHGHYAREQFRAGDRLDLEGRLGTLVRVGPLTSELEVEDGRLVVPNRLLVETPVTIRPPVAPE